MTGLPHRKHEQPDLPLRTSLADDTAIWRIGRADHILVNNSGTTDIVDATLHDYLITLSRTLPLIFATERALAELMAGCIKINRVKRASFGAAYPQHDQDEALFGSLTDLAAKLAHARFPVTLLAAQVAPVALVENDPEAASVARSIYHTDAAVADLITALTAREDAAGHIRDELAVVCRIREQTAQTFRDISALLSLVMDNGIDYEFELNTPPHFADAA